MQSKFLVAIGGTLFTCASTVVIAEETTPLIEETIVVAHPLSAEGLSQASIVLGGEALKRKTAGTIGATLAQEPGVHSSSFGTAVARPVIHGLGGPRIKVMEDRIDALDVSVTSADHAVTVEPFIADRIEVLKGSSTLLYGTGAIGGVVDVHTGRIPHNVPDALNGGIETRFDDNADGNVTTGKLNGGGGGFAWHLDGTIKDGDEYDIPGFAESSRLRALEEAEEEEEVEAHEEEEEVRGRLPGSDFDMESYAGGASVIGDWGFFGVSISRLEADYGLPGGHGHEEEGEEEEGEEHGEEEEGNPVLDLEQTRYDLELGLNDPFDGVTAINVRLGINDYEHQEIEPSGEVATQFENDAWELRGEVIYALQNWRGVVGVQHQSRDFSALGEEAFVPPVDSTDTSLFWVGERDLGNADLELGLRVGRVEHDPSAGSSESFTTYALSVGGVIPLNDNTRLGLLLDHSSRAPVGEELFSNGPHLATGRFEIGDPTLDEEVATSLSATVEHRSERWNATVTGYVTQFSDFIYEEGTGAEMDELPVFQFFQEDATFIGLDAELAVIASTWDGGDLTLRAMFDVVSAELDISGNDNPPRIPPLRFGLGAEARFGRITASLDYLRAAKQDNQSASELETDGYDDLRAYIGARFDFSGGALDLFLSGRNLTDDEQRYHTSFIKEFAPAPGRRVEAGARLTF